MPDWRVELILRVQGEHMVSSAASKDSPQGERWDCRCGVKFKGDGALKKGHRHEAEQIVAAMDQVQVAS